MSSWYRVVIDLPGLRTPIWVASQPAAVNEVHQMLAHLRPGEKITIERYEEEEPA